MENEKITGTQGWQSFLASKQEMLYQYKIAQKYSKSHTVQTFHGNVAEAVFREWLIKFLPKRYAVTSGYIISQNAKDTEKMPHFDVIIYDQIESPILWHEGNPDSSKGGISRAIPAEYVVSVIEVKSSFEPETVDDAIKKLQEIEHLLVSTDVQEERYKKFLPKNFCSALIFFELRKKNKDKQDSLKNIFKLKNMRGFHGALILEGEGLDPNKTGLIELFKSKTKTETLTHKDGLLDFCGYKNIDDEIKDLYFGLLLDWSDRNFSSFMFDIVAIWNGTYEKGIVSSFHGSSFGMNNDLTNILKN